MKHTSLQHAVLYFVIVFTFVACHSKQLSPAESLHRHIEEKLGYLIEKVNSEFVPLAQQGDQDSLQSYFLAFRLEYKSIEHIIEYYSPVTARFINGPPLDDLEVEEHRAFTPEGLQVIEELIFPYDSADKDLLITNIRLLTLNFKRVKEVWTDTTPTTPQIFDALKLQLFRIITLGISGFDSPIAKNSVPEAAQALAAIESTLRYYEQLDTLKSKSYQLLLTQLQDAQHYLGRGQSFENLNRAIFITRYVNPICKTLAQVRDEAGIEIQQEARLLRTSAVTLFDKDVFVTDFYTASAFGKQTPEKVELGKMLFYDTKLSSTGTRSCASCHNPKMAFTDGRRKSLSLSGGEINRNAPTLINASLQHFQFYDMRATTLEVQARDVVENKDEMHGSFQMTASALSSQKNYLALFRKAFTDTLAVVSPEKIQHALATYVRSLTSLKSRFDNYMRGDSTLLSADEIRGFNLFMGKAQCGICHFMPLFNGTVPPAFVETESEVIGVPKSIKWEKAEIDPDKGRFVIYEMEQLRHAFKTPTVRNSELTGPYMHNGVYTSLQEVIEFYNKGGGTGIGIDLPNQTLPSDSLGLTAKEKLQLVQFIHSLTDTVGLSSTILY